MKTTAILVSFLAVACTATTQEPTLSNASAPPSEIPEPCLPWYDAIDVAPELRQSDTGSPVLLYRLPDGHDWAHFGTTPDTRDSNQWVRFEQGVETCVVRDGAIVYARGESPR